MKKQLIYLVLLVICLTACGSPEPATVKGAKTANSFGENNNPTATPAALAADATASTVSLVSNIPAATDRTFALPTVAELDGQLLFVQGNTDNESRRLGPGGRMYLANFDGSMPVQLAERVSEASVLVSHDGSMVGYAAVDGRRWYLYVMDLTTREPIQLHQLSNRFGFIEGWSPDMQWVMLRSGATSILSSVDGQTQYDLGQVFTFWLTDNRSLVVDVSNIFGNNDVIEVEEVYIFDPTTDTRTPLDLGIAEWNTTAFPASQLNTRLAEHNTQLVPTLAEGDGVFAAPLPLSPTTQWIADFAENPVNNSTCTTHTIDRLPLAESTATPVYSIENTLALTDLHQLADGSLLFQRWYLADCQVQSESLRAELVKINPDDSMQVLTTDVYPGISTGFLRASTGRKYTLTPDERHLIWISGTLDSTQTAINIMDLQSGQHAPLLTWTSTDANSFLIWEAYTVVYWIP